MKLPLSALRSAALVALLSFASTVFAVTLNPTADTYVRSGVNQNTNYGTLTTLEIKKSASATDDFNREIYLKFDLTTVTSVQTAKLKLYGSATSPEVVSTDCYSSTNTAWTETGLTWANKPATGPVMWSTTALQNTPAWHEWDVTQFLQGEKLMGRNVVTLVLKNSVASTTGTIAFNSRENAANKPVLDITEAYPWMYYEAEAGARSAGATLETGTVWGDIAFEARGKKTVTLNATGEYVQWTSVRAATHATVRYSLADGASGTLALYVNGVKKNDLTLTSAGMRETKTGVIPVGGIVRLFDEVTVAVTGGIPANATVKLQKDVAGSTDYVIDFLEVETAPAAGTKPDATWVSVATGTGDDRAAINAAITAATTSGSKKVWIPAGNYTLNYPGSGDGGINVPAGFEVRGAGLWHTNITKNFGGDNHRLFTLTGNGVTMRNFRAIDTITTLTGNGQNVIVRANDNTSGHLIEGIWADHASLFLGFHISTSTVRGNRVRNAYKDSIHFARNAVGNLIEKNAVRNSGDDNIALIAYENTGMANNTVQYNVAECGYWGRGITNGGGTGNIVRYNVVNDCAKAGVFCQTETYSGQTSQMLTNWVADFNVVARCGNQNNHGSSGAMSIYASVDCPVSGRMEHNLILAPPYDGARMTGYVGDSGTSNIVYFRYNAIEASLGGGSRLLDNTSANTNLVKTPNTDL